MLRTEEKPTPTSASTPSFKVNTNLKVNTNYKNNINGVGQECPTYIGCKKITLP